MASAWSHLVSVVNTMLVGNFTGSGWVMQERNRTFTRPTSNSLLNPARFFYWDYEASRVEVKTVGRTRVIEGTIRGVCVVQGNGGDSVIDAFMDQLDTIADTWAATTEAASTLYFFGVQPPLVQVYEGNAENPTWATRDWDLPFLYLSPVSEEGMGILGGISSSTVQIHGPALSVLDFVGSDAGAWRRVKAVDGEPSCLGMVSIGPDSNGSATVVLSGFVRIAGGHGFAVGPLYLSQTSAGAAGAKPDSGLERKVAEVLNGTDLVVMQGPEVTV